MKKRKVFFFLSILILCPWRNVSAHRDDYINETFVYLTLPQRAFEIEYWLDFHESRPGGESSFLNSLAFEYGITSHWMVDGIGTLKTTVDGDSSFGRTRLETRYRFAEEGAWPIDLATSLEYELENEEGREHFISPRLVLSKDLIPKLNTTLNLFTRLRVADDFKAQAGYSLAVRYPAEAFLRYGIEIQGLHPNPNELLIIPQIWFAFPRDITWKLGSGVSPIGTADRFFVRSVFEIEF